MESLNDDQYDELAAKLETAIDSQVEYYEEHDDAGDAYHFLAREGDTFAMRDRLKDWLASHEIELEESPLEELLDYVLDYSEMESRHVMSSERKYHFTVDSYPLGEIEVQFDSHSITEWLGVPSEHLADFVTRVCEDNTFCATKNGDGFLAYVGSDIVWTQVISLASVREFISENSEEE